MDEPVRDDIAAAVAAHHELGRDYDSAVAESLIERIGAEIDKRVDARFATGNRGRTRPADVAQADKRRAHWTGIAIGAAVTAVPVLLTPGIPSVPHKDLVTMMVGIWVAIAAIYVVATWIRRPREAASRQEASQSISSSNE